MADISEILIGWGLGIISSPIVSFIGEYRDRESFQKGLNTEFSDIRGRTFISTVLLAQYLNKLDADFLKWMQDSYKGIKGTKIDTQLEIGRLFGSVISGEISLEQFKAIFKKRDSLTLSNLETPFLDSRINQVHLFTDGQQSRIFSVKRHVGVFNQKNDQKNLWLQKTFEIVDTSNHAKCIENELSCIEAIYSASKLIVEEIDNFLKEPKYFS